MARGNTIILNPGGIVSAASGRFTGQTSAVASVAALTTGAEASFVIFANILVTVATNHSFSMSCTYTDESGGLRSGVLDFTPISGNSMVTAITNTNGAINYQGLPVRIRAKAGTAITLATSGTFTTVTYNVEGSIVPIT